MPIDVVRFVSKESAESQRADARAALINHFVSTPESIVFNSHDDEQCDEGLYLGSHECTTLMEVVGDALIELVAHSDHPPESDFVGWQMFIYGQGPFPVYYCPFCGINLRSALRD